MSDLEHAGSADASEAEWRRSGIDRARQELEAALAPRYLLERPLGVGGMGAVLLAREPALQRYVAVKILAPALARKTVYRARFEREALAVAAISHPNVVSVYGVGETLSSLPYIVMQYVDGMPLNEWTRRHGRPDGITARRLIGEVAAALSAAHARGLVHRDIKPGNVLIERESGRALVVDFGVSALLSSGPEPKASGGESQDARLTGVGEIVGTPVYMSPEQAGGDTIDTRSDVYSLGILAFELLTGELPFKATSLLGWAAAHLADGPPLLADRETGLPGELVVLLDRSLAKAPEERPSALELATAFLPSLEADLLWPPPGLAPLQRTGRHFRRAAAAGTIGTVLLTAALALPPRAIRPAGEWWTEYAVAQQVAGSSLGVMREPEAADPRAGILVWRIVALIGTLAATGGLGTALFMFVQCAYQASRKAERNWRLDTLLDVAADPDGRTGLLLGEQPRGASLPRADRTGLRRDRRRVLALLAIGGIVSLLALGSWALAATTGLWRMRGAAPLVSPVVMALLAIPLLALLLMARRARARDAVLARTLPLPAATAERPVPTRESKPAAGDLVAGWYASRAGLGDPSGTPHQLGLPALVCALPALGMLAAIALVASAALAGAGRMQAVGSVTAQLAERIRAPLELDPIAQLRQQLRRYLPPKGAVSADSVTLWIAALADTATLPPYPTAPAELLAGMDPTDDAMAGHSAAAIIHADPGLIGKDARAIASHPRTLLIQRLARAPIRFSAIAEPPYPMIREAAQGNVVAAVIALTEGDTSGAATRLGENAAIALDMLDIPSVFATRFATGMLQDLAVLPLAALAERRGGVAVAESLRTGAGNVREDVFSPAWDHGFDGLASSPRSSTTLLEAVRNPLLPKGLALQAVPAIEAGSCLNAREILSGRDPARDAVARALASELGVMAATLETSAKEYSLLQRVTACP